MANQTERLEKQIDASSMEIGPAEGLSRSPQGIQTAQDIQNNWGYYFDRRF